MLSSTTLQVRHHLIRWHAGVMASTRMQDQMTHKASHLFVLETNLMQKPKGRLPVNGASNGRVTTTTCSFMKLARFRVHVSKRPLLKWRNEPLNAMLSRHLRCRIQWLMLQVEWSSRQRITLNHAVPLRLSRIAAEYSYKIYKTKHFVCFVVCSTLQDDKEKVWTSTPKIIVLYSIKSISE